MSKVDEEAPAPTLSFDDELLQRVTRDAGQWAFGTVAVETWVLNKDQTLLVRSESGTWVDPLLHAECLGEKCPYCRLTDPTSAFFVPTPPLPPGCGVPGVLWSEASTFRPRPSSNNAIQSERHLEVGSVDAKRVAWRDAVAIANDPDQPYNERLQIGVQLKLGWTAAVPFFVNDNQGIVIYWAREGVDLNRLMSPTNEQYLCSASNLIASAWALRGPRLAVLEERDQALDNALRRARAKLLSLIHMGVTLNQLASEPQKESKKQDSLVQGIASQISQLSNPTGLMNAFVSKIRTVYKKLKGGNVQPPPAFSFEQALLTFFASLTSLLALTRFNVWLGDHGSDYTMSLGPFGALMTLQYGLTAAPASQPRNAILGQTLSISVALAVSELDIDLWLRQSIATALAISLMVKFGITHPPAGAAALIFSSGKYKWKNLGFMLVGNVIAIGSATLLNNASTRRQYPTFWGFGYAIENVKKLLRQDQKNA